jgi:hypothetical protein
MRGRRERRTRKRTSGTPSATWRTDEPVRAMPSRRWWIALEVRYHARQLVLGLVALVSDFFRSQVDR